MSIISIAAVIIKLAGLGISLSKREERYLKWRVTEAGQRHFNRIENNEFYTALEKGNMTLVDIIRKEKQQRIMRLRRKLGLGLVMLLLTGCAHTKTIPVRMPHLDPASLKESDKSYTVTDMKVFTGGEIKILKGKWYVVSGDYIREHNENQDTLIETMQQLDKKRSNIRRIFIGIGIIAAVCWVIAGVWYKRKHN